LALGCLNHENAVKRYPTNGWGYVWTGDADRGSDWRQPGGWIYNILPYIEQRSLYDMGAGLPTAEKNAQNLLRMTTPLSVLICPTRRQVVLYPWDNVTIAARSVVNAGSPPAVVRNDYAANGGSYYTAANCPDNPPGWSSASPNTGAGPASLTEVEYPPGQMTAGARSTFRDIAKCADGVFYLASMITPADVSDGASITYLLGEKHVHPVYYTTGGDQGDNEDALAGDNADICRWTATNGLNSSVFYPPVCDKDVPAGYVSYIQYRAYGSAHTNGFHIAFCDGSVQVMNFSIDKMVHCYLSNRKDGRKVDAKSY
jgi:prepilin-type processing-associated H-X9-DG protein